ncbi:MAG: ABC transporter substrate-binding protein [Acidimicrobiia bacterium]
MRRRTAFWMIMAALLALSLVAAACGGDDDDGGSGGGGETADIDPNGILKLPADLTQPTFAQIDPISVDVLLSTLHEYLYGTLLKLNADGEIEPGLAEKVEVVDASNLVVTLREGLKFTDGTVLDAEALKFSWERTVTQAKPGGIEAEFREFKTLTVTSPTEMKVELKTPIAGAFFRLMRFAEASPVSPTAVKAGVDFNKAPVGAGPFKLETWVPSQTMKLVKNPDYWDAENVKLAGIEYVNTTAQSMTNAVRSNGIDFTILSAPQAREVAGTPGWEVPVEPTNGVQLIAMMCKSRPPFDNLKVRQALNFAIDRDALNEVLYDGKGEPMNGFNSSNTPFYDEDLEGTFSYDPDEAKKLLAEAGVPNLEFTMLFTAGTDGQQGGEILQQQLLESGIKINLRPIGATQDFFPEALAGPAYFFPLQRVGLPKISRTLVPGTIGNPCAWNDPELNDLVAKLRAVEETSPEGIALWKKISEYGLRKAVWVFGVFGTQAYGINSAKVDGIEVYEGRTGLPTLDVESVYVKR